MKKLISLVALCLVGCAGAQPAFNSKAVPAAPTLTPPSTEEVRKVFSGKDWQLSVEDTGWRKGSSDGMVLALMNMDTRMIVLLEGKKTTADLATVAEEHQNNFRKDSEWTKEEVLFAGYPGIKYSMVTLRSHIWAWLMVANGKSWMLTCGTAAYLAEQNAEACEDISKHFVAVKVEK